jgi:hypothetical protein
MEIVGTRELPSAVGDPTGPVTFTSWWMFAQQLYLLHDLYARPPQELDEYVKFGFLEAFGASDHDRKSWT